MKGLNKEILELKKEVLECTDLPDSVEVIDKLILACININNPVGGYPNILLQSFVKGQGK